MIGRRPAEAGTYQEDNRHRTRREPSEATRGVVAASGAAPAIILFDEIDSFASSRDMMSESFEATLVSQLLSLMDGMNELGRVCVIATTNRPSALDPALRRPGRFDHEIEVGLPDADARLHILEIHTKGMPVAPDLDLKQLATLTRDYSGADPNDPPLYYSRSTGLASRRSCVPRLPWSSGTRPWD